LALIETHNELLAKLRHSALLRTGTLVSVDHTRPKQAPVAHFWAISYGVRSLETKNVIAESIFFA
jgi:hypothetical protein